MLHLPFRSAHTRLLPRARSTSLRHAHAGAPDSSFEERLAGILEEDCKGCDTDVGGCGTLTKISHVLARAPAVFTISLAWETSQAGEEEVAATLKARGLRGVRVLCLRRAHGMLVLCKLHAWR